MPPFRWYMRNDQEPSIARRCAQIKQQLKVARCIHPEQFICIEFLLDGGYIQYCSDCMYITDHYVPDIKRSNETQRRNPDENPT
jgi:hypothetical protein